MTVLKRLVSKDWSQKTVHPVGKESQQRQIRRHGHMRYLYPAKCFYLLFLGTDDS